MEASHVVVMIVGILALIGIRLIVSFVGRDFREDHATDTPSAAPAASPETPATAPRKVIRGTGKSHHLMYYESDDDPPAELNSPTTQAS